MASKVLNPLYLLPLCQFSLCHDTVKPLILVPERGKGECLFASPHTCALTGTAGPRLKKKKHLRHIYHQYSCLLEQTSEILYIIPFVLTLIIFRLDPLRISAALGVLIHLLLGEKRFSTGIFRELQRPELTCTWLWC